LLAAARLRPLFEDDADAGDVKADISLTETATGEEVAYLETGDFSIWGFTFGFTPDSRRLVVADLTSLRIWDTDTGAPLHQMTWPKSVRGSLHFVCPLPSFRTAGPSRACKMAICSSGT
jgi:hypothetical protein